MGPIGPGSPLTFQSSDVSPVLHVVTDASMTRSDPPDLL
jgi:hypothetical protein